MLARALILLLLLVALTACGVPRAAQPFAAAQAIADISSMTDDDIRAALRRQDAAWSTFATLIHQREPFGLPAVDQCFLQTIDTVRATARRQCDLMDAHTDDPAKNRQLLTSFNRLWQKSATYLAQ